MTRSKEMAESLPIQWPSGLSKNQRYLIGVSGGLDSMALLHLLSEHGYSQGIVCHLNHGLRGRAAAEDARLVKKIASQLGYEVAIKKIDLREEISENKTSLESAARKARHQFFAECSRQHDCKTLFLAHHLDEQAETILWNLIRGSAGLRGMKASSTLTMDQVIMRIYRPLLGVRKKELREWMKSRKLGWREDASNTVNDVARNRIRNQVLPLLDEIAKRDVAPLIYDSAHFDETMREAVDETLQKTQVLDPQGRLHLGALKTLPNAFISQVIFDYLKSKNIKNLNHRLIEQCRSSLDPRAPAKVGLPGGSYFIRRAGRAFVE